MSLEDGILGFLAMKPMSGYDIKKLFNISASYFWPADQNQIYRTLKKLNEDGLLELQERRKGETVDKKVYAITDKGRKTLQNSLVNNTVEDFISRDAFLMQLFFSGVLSAEEQLELIDTQLRNVKQLIDRLIDNYNINLSRFMAMTELNKDDRRIQSAVWSHRWGLMQCSTYKAHLEEIKKELMIKGV